jgi:ribosomal-protein-alanine N-acetyltransferase
VTARPRPVLEGPNVRLRPILAEDIPHIFPWVNDPERVAPFDRFAVDSPSSFAESIEHEADDPHSLAPRFLVERRSDGLRLGIVGFYSAHPVLTILDVWYILGATAERGKGFGREAVGLLVDYLFRTTPVERVGATCDTQNLPSARLVEGLGFRREGTLISALYHHARWHDVAVYGITRSEWAARPR